MYVANPISFFLPRQTNECLVTSSGDCKISYKELAVTVRVSELEVLTIVLATNTPSTFWVNNDHAAPYSRPRDPKPDKPFT